ncbi:hypothetical protein ACVWZK_008703 [Bradyrhizobium sp. GM0.4]
MVVFSLPIITLLGATEHVERDVLQFNAEIFRDRLAKETQFPPSKSCGHCRFARISLRILLNRAIACPARRAALVPAA